MDAVTQDPLARIESAFRKLKIRPSRERLLPGMVRILGSLVGKANTKTPPQFLIVGRQRSNRELQRVAELASLLAEALGRLHEPGVVALADQGVLRHRVIPPLQAISKAARKAKGRNRGPRKPVTGRKQRLEVKAIAKLVGRAYRLLTGRKPTISTDWDTGKASGPFIELMTRIFRALRVKGSPEAAAREICRKVKRRKVRRKSGFNRIGAKP